MNSWLPLRAFEKPFQDRPKPALETLSLKLKTKKIFQVLGASEDFGVTVGQTIDQNSPLTVNYVLVNHWYIALTKELVPEEGGDPALVVLFSNTMLFK